MHIRRSVLGLALTLFSLIGAPYALAKDDLKSFGKPGQAISETDDFPVCPKSLIGLDLAYFYTPDDIKTEQIAGGMDYRCIHMEVLDLGFFDPEYRDNVPRSLTDFYRKTGRVYKSSAEALTQSVETAVTQIRQVPDIEAIERPDALSAACNQQADLVTEANRYDLDIMNTPSNIRETAKAGCEVYLWKYKGSEDWDAVSVFASMDIDGWYIVSSTGALLDDMDQETAIGVSTALFAQQKKQPQWLIDFIGSHLE